MSLPSSLFPLTNEMGLEVGQRVRFESRSLALLDPDAPADYTVSHDGGETWTNYVIDAEGEGIVNLIWYCLDTEAVKVSITSEKQVAFPVHTPSGLRRRVGRLINIYPEWDMLKIIP